MSPVTPAQRDLAALDIELAKRLGEEPDPRMVAIANGESPSGERERPRSDATG